MLNKIGLVVCGLLLVALLNSCKDQDFGGAEYINYPDLIQIFDTEINTKEPQTYTKVHQEGEQKDSSLVPYDQMPWAEIKNYFEQANLYNEELNFKYSADVMKDETLNTRSLFYEALDPDMPTKSVSIVSSETPSKLQSIYFDYEDKKGTVRLLLAPHDYIQIQKRQNDKVEVDTYYYQ